MMHDEAKLPMKEVIANTLSAFQGRMPGSGSPAAISPGKASSPVTGQTPCVAFCLRVASAYHSTAEIPGIAIVAIRASGKGSISPRRYKAYASRKDVSTSACMDREPRE